MPEAPSHFIYNFFILFLGILLLMFVMFEVMVHYDPDVRTGAGSSTVLDEGRKSSDASGRSPRDLTPLYRANLFAIDLCLTVLAEALLIILFVRFTIPAALIATVIIIFMMTSASQRLRSELIPGFLSRFVTNRYATLSHTDMLLLIALSGLVMSFLVSVLLKQGNVQIQSAPKKEDAAPPPSPP